MRTEARVRDRAERTSLREAANGKAVVAEWHRLNAGFEAQQQRRFAAYRLEHFSTPSGANIPPKPLLERRTARRLNVAYHTC